MFLKKCILAIALYCSYSQFAIADSVYDLKTKWRDIENSTTDMAINKGFYTLITMVYTKCAHACPMTISKLKEIENDFSKIPFKNVKFTLASFDVKHDRPDQLKKYLTQRRLDPSQWKLLAAETEDDARKVAVALGISYKDIGDGDFSHSNLIALVDQKGNVLASINSLNASTEPLLNALKESLIKNKYF
jgi:protein SCO1/2